MVGYYGEDSLRKARKVAEESDCTSTDDDCVLGRGSKRKCSTANKESESSEEELPAPNKTGRIPSAVEMPDFDFNCNFDRTLTEEDDLKDSNNESTLIDQPQPPVVVNQPPVVVNQPQPGNIGNIDDIANRQKALEGVPSSVEFENNSNQNKYTVNRNPKTGVTLSKLALFLMALGAVLLILLAIGLTILLYPKCATAVVSAALTQKPTKSNQVAARLPNSISPEHYRVQLIPFLERNFTTSGAVSIILEAKSDTYKIALNTYDIEIIKESVTVKYLNKTNYINVTNQKYDNISQIYTIQLRDSLTKGQKYELVIKFTGHLNDKMQGFYRSHYVDSKSNTQKWMASTQFSPTDARRAFPCFDEPAFKAKFTISIARPNNMSTISNMPKRSTDIVVDKENWEWDHYGETPLMSTYLVAFVMSDLQANRYNSSGKLFTVWTRANFVGQTRFVIELSPQILQYFENYFDIKFPLPKIDLVGVPDFGFSAMENWGLITFKESVLLFDEKTSTIDDKRALATILAHEITHQWFGNLVTPRWWDDLWLKEGFSSYLNFLAIDNILPEWNILNEFLSSEMYAAFEIDSLKSSHSISFDVITSDDIRQMFNPISYSKGASIVRMINHILGETDFKSGLIKYLNKYKYGNAHHDDLWTALTPENSEELGGTVKEIMDSWTTQAGFPVITAIRNTTSNEVYVSQKRFLLTKENKDKSLWWVPISYTTDLQQEFNETKPQFWLKNKQEGTFSLESNEWWLLNLQQTGYYLVNYDEQSWRNLTRYIMNLPQITRVQLISDSMRLARANLLDYDIPLRMITQMAIKDEETSFTPHEAAFDQITFLYNMLVSTSIYKNFEDFLFRIFYHAFDKYNFEEKSSDDYLTQKTRRIILNWSCKKSDSKCTNDARVLFRQWVEHPRASVIPPNVQKVVFCTSIREGGHTEWNLAFKQYLISESIYQKQILLDSLGCSRTPWILSRYLELILSNGTEIRKQDCARVFKSVANNPVGHGIAFDYIRKNWNALNEHFGPAFSIISKMVAELPMYMNSEYQLQELENFKTSNINNLGTSEQAFNRAIEIAKVNVEWMKHSYSSIEKWLEEQTKHYGYKK